MGARKPAPTLSTARLKAFCRVAMTATPAISVADTPKAMPDPIKPYSLYAANTVSNSTPSAPPCNAWAKAGFFSRCCQPKAKPSKATRPMPDKRNHMGALIQPCVLA